MNTEIQSRLDFTEFKPRQRNLLSKMQGRIASMIDKALDRFYEKVRETPETARFFRDQSHISHAKRAQETHWTRIASGNFDDQFYDSVRRIGAVHSAIGLEPRWYIGAYALVLEQLLRDVGRTPLQRLLRLPAPQAEASIAIVKAALLDMDLSVSIYFEDSQRGSQQAAIEAFEEALTALSQGELSHELSGLPEGFEKLEESYNNSLSSLRGLIGSVRISADAIQGGAAEISQASEDLARRTEGNAASLEETSASMEEVDRRVKATAIAAAQTVERADKTIGTVSTGRSMAEVAVQAMERVSENAKNTDEVIEGLDKIAFQTRVLAMNAATEAGRAGEAGRGFAVVADLVSALAMRAEEEARNAREQLTATQGYISNAVDAVRNVDGALSDISTGVGEVHELLATMANDNQAQSAALTEISTAISDMDRSTQQNAAMVEQTSAAARNLSVQVQGLAAEAARFNVGDAGMPPRAPNKVHEMLAQASSAVNKPSHPVAKRVANGSSHDEGSWNEF